MKKYWKIEDLIKSLKDDGYNYWIDERCVMRSLDTFVPVFFAKYAPSIAFTIEFIAEEKPHIWATNISGFQYIFPVAKK